MSNKTIYISSYDRDRLLALMLERRENKAAASKKYYSDLETELRRAAVLPPQEVPADVITMNSRVRLRDQDSGEEMTYTLVFPEQADPLEGKLSVLAPVGTALLGYRVGDEVEWEVPDGVRRLIVEELEYQPESAGDYHL